MSDQTPIVSPRDAEQAVEAFEALALGADPAPPRQAAERAVERLHAPGVAAFFHLAPHTADAIGQLQFEIEPFSRSTYGAELVALAGRALAHHPALARALRSAPILARLEAAIAWSFPDAPARQAARRAALQALAAVYHQAAAHDEPARLLAVVVPGFDQRIAATAARHEAHADADAARRQADEAAFEAQVQQGLLRFTEAMRQWFDSRPGQLFIVGEAHLNGIQVGRRVLERVNIFTGAVDPGQLTRAVAIRATCERGFRMPTRDEFHALGADEPPKASVGKRLREAVGL